MSHCEGKLYFRKIGVEQECNWRNQEVEMRSTGIDENWSKFELLISLGKRRVCDLVPANILIPEKRAEIFPLSAKLLSEIQLKVKIPAAGPDPLKGVQLRLAHKHTLRSLQFETRITLYVI